MRVAPLAALAALPALLLLMGSGRTVLVGGVKYRVNASDREWKASTTDPPYAEVILHQSLGVMLGGNKARALGMMPIIIANAQTFGLTSEQITLLLKRQREG